MNAKTELIICSETPEFQCISLKTIQFETVPWSEIFAKSPQVFKLGGRVDELKHSVIHRIRITPGPRVKDHQSRVLQDDEIGSSIRESLVFSFAIAVAPKDVKKTAITMPFRLFEFSLMTFGLRNAAQTLQRFIDEVTRDLDFVFAYISNSPVVSENKEQHHEHLRLLFRRL